MLLTNHLARGLVLSEQNRHDSGWVSQPHIDGENCGSVVAQVPQSSMGANVHERQVDPTEAIAKSSSISFPGNIYSPPPSL